MGAAGTGAAIRDVSTGYGLAHSAPPYWTPPSKHIAPYREQMLPAAAPLAAPPAAAPRARVCCTKSSGMGSPLEIARSSMLKPARQSVSARARHAFGCVFAV
eukprot:1853840-Rhodomonas_salina.2